MDTGIIVSPHRSCPLADPSFPDLFRYGGRIFSQGTADKGEALMVFQECLQGEALVICKMLMVGHGVSGERKTGWESPHPGGLRGNP